MKKWNNGRILETLDEVIKEYVLNPRYSMPYDENDMKGIDLMDRFGETYQVKYTGFGKGKLENSKQGKSSANNTARRKMIKNDVTYFIIFTVHCDGITFDESNIDMYIVNRNAIYRNKCFSYHKDKKSIYQTNEQIKKLYNMSFYDKNGNREAFRAENVISLEALCKMIEE